MEVLGQSLLFRGVTYCVLRVEDVRGRWVVYDDDFTEFSAQPAEVFNVVSSVENTGFPEEPGAKHPPLVQQVCHRVGILNEPKNIRLIESAQSRITVTIVLVLQRVDQPWLSSLWRGCIQRALPSFGGTRPRGAFSARTPGTTAQNSTHLLYASIFFCYPPKCAHLGSTEYQQLSGSEA